MKRGEFLASALFPLTDESRSGYSEELRRQRKTHQVGLPGEFQITFVVYLTQGFVCCVRFIKTNIWYLCLTRFSCAHIDFIAMFCNNIQHRKH